MRREPFHVFLWRAAGVITLLLVVVVVLSIATTPTPTLDEASIEQAIQRDPLLWAAPDTSAARKAAASTSTPSPVMRGGIDLKEACTNWVYFRDRSLETGAPRMQENFRAATALLAQFPDQDEVTTVCQAVAANR